jgi:hypothetical protein
MTTKSKQTIVRRILRARARAKAQYDQADVLTRKLIEAVPIGEVIESAEGRFRIVDAFASGNVAWGHGSVRRFDLERVKEPRIVKKEIDPPQAVAA